MVIFDAIGVLALGEIPLAGGPGVNVSLLEAATAADGYSVFISRSSTTRPPARRDAWDRDDWGRWIPGAGIRQ